MEWYQLIEVYLQGVVSSPKALLLPVFHPLNPKGFGYVLGVKACQSSQRDCKKDYIII